MRRLRSSPHLYIIILFVFSLAVFAAIFAAFFLLHNAQEKASTADGSIVIVSGSGKAGAPRADLSTQPAATQPPLPVLSEPDIDHLIATSLPSLHDPKTACASGSCTVTASMAQTSPELAQTSLEHVVTQEVPSTISQAGYKLLEPVQIEEVGPDAYRVKFRLGAKDAIR